MKQKLLLALLAVSAVAFAACGGPAGNSSNNVVDKMSPNTNNSPVTSNPGARNTNEVSGDGNPTVGGAAMFKTKDIVDNAVNSKDHTMLVAAVKAAGLVETLKGAGPFTVFAPTNAAFEKLPAGTVDTLMKPESKAGLTKILTYHVVAGRQDAASIAKAIEDGKGKAAFKTVAGGTLTASMENGNVVLTDEKGGKSKVTTSDVVQSNGVIHVVDTVLMPK